MNAIFEEVAGLRKAVECFIKGKSHLAVSLPFRTDIFKFLFQANGMKQKGWYVLGRDCFPVQYFPDGWGSVMDIHGQGVQLGYPIRVRSFLNWSPGKYVLSNSGTLIPAQRCYTEIMSFRAFRKAGGQ